MGTIAIADDGVQEVMKEVMEIYVTSQPSLAGVLLPIISGTQACTYEAMEYFVAWQGVLTIAYTGIPSSIVQFKQELEGTLKGVKKENPGSKWPKTTIGCLKDDKTLTLDQLKTLKKICCEETLALAGTEPECVDNVSIVLYENRRLERIITEATIPLALPLNTSKPTDAERAHVKGIVAAFDDENLENYHEFTSTPGYRSTHYITPVVEATLVHYLKTVPPALIKFRNRVDAELPGMYDWFADSSLHITIRALS